MLPTSDIVVHFGYNSEQYEKEKEQYMHLNAEIAFSYREHINLHASMLSKSEIAFQTETERNYHTQELLNLINLGVQHLTKAEFFFQAIKLN